MSYLSEAHALWLEQKRGLRPELCAKFGLISKGDEIGFPYNVNGQSRYWKVRRTDKSAWRIHPAGQSLVPYNIDELSETNGRGQTLVITEGEFDSIAVAHCGHYTISVPNGAPAKPGEGDINPLSDTGFAYLWVGGKLHPDIAKFDRIVLATDADGPGQVLAQELAIRIGRTKCYLPNYPDGCKDANDVLLVHGLEALGRTIRDARPLVPDKLIPFSEVELSSREMGLTSGWIGLDKHLRLTFPELVTITGTPGAGKSQWTLAWVANLARLHGIKVAIMQLEDSPARNKADLLAYAHHWRTTVGDNAQAWVDQYFVCKVPPEADEDEDPVTLPWLRDAIEEAACRHGCKIVVIDPWNEVEHAWGRTQSETQYVNDALRELKRIARRYQIAIVIVAHPSAAVKGKKLDELTLYDVAGSAAWRNKSDHGIIIYREDEAEETAVKIAKCKDYKTMGTPGVVTMRFASPKATFEFVRKGA
jgi:twinkle protein